MPLIRHWPLNLGPPSEPKASGLGCGLKARNAGADLLAAASVRQVFQQALIGLDRCRALATQLLGAGDADEAFLIEEGLRFCSVNDGLKGGLGCSVILLGLPAEPHDADGPQAEDNPPGPVLLPDPFEQAHRRRSSPSSLPVSPARAGSARSSQISPLTDDPSAAEKLPALSVPVRTPEGRMSRCVVADRLPRTLPAMRMDAALMLASTWAVSETVTRPETSISPSKRP